uniref:Electron transfer flavoprotein beta-subunit n=1 Tax=Arundo donax TaxID=35708 RepID=A0A0A9D3U6_ARUDO
MPTAWRRQRARWRQRMTGRRRARSAAQSTAEDITATVGPAHSAVEVHTALAMGVDCGVHMCHHPNHTRPLLRRAAAKLPCAVTLQEKLGLVILVKQLRMPMLWVSRDHQVFADLPPNRVADVLLVSAIVGYQVQLVSAHQVLVSVIVG